MDKMIIYGRFNLLMMVCERVDFLEFELLVILMMLILVYGGV